LPEDGGRPAVVLVIVEPLELQAPSGPPGARMAAPPIGQNRGLGPQRGSTPSVISSVHSEDITANDSVSNVNVRY